MNQQIEAVNGAVGSVVYPTAARDALLTDCESRWYVAHTRARHEKCVDLQLGLYAIERFLPLCETIRQWKDRRKRLRLPLFPGYVFVRIAWRDRLKVLQIPSVVRFVGFNGAPAFLEDYEIGRWQRALAEGIRAEPHPFLIAGRRVRIRTGPLAGCQGILKRWKGNLRVVMSIELIQRSISLDIDAASLEPTSH
jgi:transcription antitermination factor NusG